MTMTPTIVGCYETSRTACGRSVDDSNGVVVSAVVHVAGLAEIIVVAILITIISMQ